MCVYTNSTAHGGGGSFNNRKPTGEVGGCEHGWQSESTDGPAGGWSCVFFGMVAMVAVVTLPQLLGVVRCSAVVVVVAVVAVGVG
jgi:hypothetical protein